MAATLQTASTAIGSTPQMRASVRSPKVAEVKESLDKENGMILHENSLHREILEKLKHESASQHDSHLLTEQLVANYHKQMTNTPISAAAQHAAELFRREALLSLQSSVRPNLDYFGLAALQEQQLLATAAQRNVDSSVRSSQSPSGSSEDGVESMSPNRAPSAGGQWTYEEQFKQLYELGDEPDRREFLDDLFAFMQKRGTPVNRIPIMAKQTLDMYKLFKLVVSKGGLVEVINKKLWREITKGLNLPSSITSAAFTLRTQYMKYIYPYECEKYDFSKASELQAAIDGNRREGRRPGYGYDITSPGAMPPFYNPQTFPATNPFFNPSVMSSPMANLLSTQLNGYMHSNGLGGHISHPRIPTTAPHNVNLHEMEERAHSPIDVSSPITSSNQSAFSRPHAVTSYDSCTSAAKRQRHSSGEGINVTNNDNDNEFRGQGKITSVTSEDSRNCRTEANTGDFKDTLPKLPKTESRDQSLSIKLGSSSRSPGLSSTNIKITNNEDYTKKESDSSSLTVSMEVNGVLYEGILLAKR